MTLAGAVALTLASPQAAQAQSVWTGTESEDWFDESNWIGGIPGADIDTIIDTSDPNAAVVDGDDAYTGQLFVGHSNNGELTIQNGGTVGSAYNFIGFDAGARGTVTVTGSGSMWNSSVDLNVGYEGEGELTIADGGTVNSNSSFIGTEADARGTVTVTGSGSMWNNSFQLQIGYRGEGELTIADGGTVDSYESYIAGWTGGRGTATVTGSGSMWNNSFQFFVGFRGEGELTIADGGTVDSTSSYIGFDTDARGTVTVAGSGSTWNSGGLTVSYRGEGELTIADSGRVDSTFSYIGRWTGGGGTVTVTGSGSTWNSGELRVGFEGEGEMTIADGGMVRVTNNVTLAHEGTAFGTLNIGATQGEAAEAAGDLDALELHFGDGTATLVFNHTDTGYEFATPMSSIGSGSHAIDHLAGTTILRGDSADFSGLTTVSGGTLEVAGALGGTALVDGGHLRVSGTLVNSGSLNVGFQGEGELTIADGGTVNSNSSFIGGWTGGRGTVTVTGSGSTWNSGNLYVGNSGEGELTIADGGTVGSAFSSIGYESDARGTVTVTGSGSTWSGGNFYVGFLGEGELTIADGGTVDSYFSYIGYDVGARGTVTVTGSGSTWNNDALRVGFLGDGELTIADGGTVGSAYSFIGFDTDVRGTVTVTGSGSTWNNSGSFYIGFDGDGELTLADGGTMAVTDDVDLALEVTSTGTLNIGAARGDVAAAAGDLETPALRFGSGTATLVFNHTDTGYGFATPMSSIGSGSHAIDHLAGTTILSGDSSGFSGLTTVSGGTLEVAGALGGTALVDGGHLRVSGTLVNSGSLNVGFQGEGELTIADGGTVDSSEILIGFDAGARGTVTVTGSGSRLNSSSLRVGSWGEGELTIADGGTVDSTFSYIGTESDARGTVTVTGSGSMWNNNFQLIVGLRGEGELTIADGGAVDSPESYIGGWTGGRGTVTVTGSGSTWNSDLLFVGPQGEGELTIADGGTVDSTSNYIGYESDARGTVTVTGSGSTWNSGSLPVGVRGEGELTIADGGRVDSAASNIGDFDGGRGTVTVTGSGSTWNSSGFLNVGRGGEGELTIADGGTVAVTGDVDLALEGSSTGTLNIGAAQGESAEAAGDLDALELHFGDGTATLFFNHTDTGYEFATPMSSIGSGSHAIDHLAGTTILSGDSSGFTGLTTVSGGTLAVDGTLGGDIDVQGSGTLAGAGTINGNVGFDSGTLAGIQGQTLTIEGNLALNANTAVNVALGGVPSDALFAVGGDLTLDGTLNVTDAGGFGIGLYRIFDYGGALDGTGLTVGTAPDGIHPDALLIQTEVDGQVNLLSAAGAVLKFWDGGNTDNHDNGAIDGGDGAWRADGRNWTGEDGAINGPFLANQDYAIFMAEAGVVVVDATAGDIQTTGMQFASNGYRIEGDAIALSGENGERIIRVGDGSAAGAAFTATIAAELTGGQGLVKADHGRLVLEGDNSYSGGTELRGGVLEIATDGSLGDTAGALSFTGGALATTSSFDSTRAVTLAATGRFDVAGDTQLGLSGAVTGAGDLHKVGDGTLVLTGDNAYGNTRVEAGTLVGSTDSLSGDIANAGTVVFDQGADAGFAGDIGGFSGTNGAMIKTGAGTLTLNGASSLDWTVDEGGLVSATDRFGGDLTIGTDGAFTFDQATAGSYAGTISGVGTLASTGNGEVRLTGDGTGFSGLTNVFGGTLEIAGTLGGTTRVDGGHLLVSGTLNNSGPLRVGIEGEGEMTIASGGAVSSDENYIGDGTDSGGTVTVTGSGSTWSNNILFVGYEGEGELTIANGGTVMSSAYSAIGFGTDSRGTVTVTGSGSMWDSGIFLDLGHEGEGELTIAEGGVVNSIESYIGYGTDSGGTATVTGSGSTWNNSDSLRVGFQGEGKLTVAESGTVNSLNSFIGDFAGASGTVTVTGSGSTWNNSGSFQVGFEGDGELTIADGGTVATDGDVDLALQGTSTGTLNIGAARGEDAAAAGHLETPVLRFGSGTATLVFNHTETGYGFATPMSSVDGGTHAIEHLAGTTILSGDNSGFSGLTTVSGGTLAVDGTLGGDTDVQGSGTLAGAGTINGDVGFDGGTLAGVQGQTLTIAGNLVLDGDTAVNVALGGAPSDALFDVGNDLTLDGTLHVTDAGGFGVGVYRLFDYGGALDGTGLTVGTAPDGIHTDSLFVQTAVAGQVNLVSAAGVELWFWDGGDSARHDNGVIDGGDGAWRADGRNWTGEDGAINGPFHPNPTFVVFMAEAGVVTVDATAGDIAATGMQFASDGYRIEGDAIALSGENGERIIRVGDGSAAGAAFTATIAAELTGAQGLVKSDHGRLVLLGDNSYAGGTELRGGVLEIAADGSLGDTAGGLSFTGGTLATTSSFDCGRAVTLASTGRFDVAGGTQLGLSGVVAGPGDLHKSGDGTLVLTGANAYGDTRVEAGTLVGSTASLSGDLTIWADAALTFDQANDGSYAGTIAGAGTLAFTGGGAVWLTGNGAGFSGLGTVAGSTLIVDGAFGGTLEIHDGGVLGGTGTVGTTTVAAGGTLAPGMSPGTLTVNGDLTLASGSTYAVDAGPDAVSDLVAVAGQAFLQGGSVLHVGAGGNHAPNAAYTILTAAGGIDGTFGEVSSVFAFLEAALNYDANAVSMTLVRNDVGFDAAGQTANQIGTARGAESLGFGHGVYDALVLLDAEGARAAFDQLSGEAHASARGAFVDDARFLRDGIGRRLDGGAVAGDLHADGRATLWLSGAGRYGRTDTDGNATEGRTHREGLMFGADLALGDRVRLGAVLGANELVQRIDGRASRIDADGLHYGLYAQSDWGRLHLRGGVTRSEYDVDTVRHVAFPGLDNRLTASYDTRATTVLAESGYRIGDDATALTPYLGVAHVRLATDATQEAGGDSALALASSKDEVLTATLGLRGHWDISAGGVERAQLQGGLGFQHAWGELRADSRAHFPGGEAFTVYGLPLARNSVVVDLGVELSPSARSRLGLGMHGRTGGDQREFGVQMDWRVSF